MGKNSIADEVKFYLDVNYSEKLRLQDVARTFGVYPKPIIDKEERHKNYL